MGIAEEIEKLNKLRQDGTLSDRRRHKSQFRRDMAVSIVDKLL